MATTVTLPQTDPSTQEENTYNLPDQTSDQSFNPNEPDQSVYVADMDMVKTYPISMSNSEIDYDLHTSLRGNSPEDYFFNFLPQSELIKTWRAFIDGGWAVEDRPISGDVEKPVSVRITNPDTLKEMADATVEGVGKLAEASPKNLADIGKAYLKWEDEQLVPMEKKLLGIQEVYKDWLTAWRESQVGEIATQDPLFGSDVRLSDAPTIPVETGTAPFGAAMGGAVAAGIEIPAEKKTYEIPYGFEVMPWFFAEYLPVTMLEFVSKPSNWLAAYGINKVSGYIINWLLSDMPPAIRSTLLKNIFQSEMDNLKYARTLKVKLNATSEGVNRAYKQQLFTLQDYLRKTSVADDLAESRMVAKRIMDLKEAKLKWDASRQNILSKIMDMFKKFKSRKVNKHLFLGKKGSAIIPFGEGDLIKYKGDVAKLIKLTGDIAVINLKGKLRSVPVSEIKEIKKKALKENPMVKPAPEEAVKEEPTAEGKIEFKRKGDAVGQEYHETIYAVDPKTKETMGYVSHSYLHGEAAIQMIEVEPKFRRKGVGLALLNELQSQSKKPLTIMGDYATKEGQALWRKFQNQSKLSTPTEGKGVAKSGVKPPTGGIPQGQSVSGPEEPDKSAVNLAHLEVSPKAQENLVQATEALGNEIENQTGVKLTHEQVIEAAKSAEVLKSGVSRENTLKVAAELLRTRQYLGSLAEEPGLTPEFLKALKDVSNTGTDIARLLNSMAIDAIPEYATVKIKMIKDIQKAGVESEKILQAAQGVDFKDQMQAAKFYRQFIKPTFSEILDEFVYQNILSSPITHIRNLSSNAIQLLGLNPLTKLASGSIDLVASKLNNTERSHYISEIPSFFRGALNAIPDAVKEVSDVMSGKATVGKPDIKHIPTLSKIPDYLTLGVGKYVVRALEAGDILFTKLIEAGEIEALSERLGHTPNEKEMVGIVQEARRLAKKYVFRDETDAKNESGQGYFLSAIDQLTNVIGSMRRVPLGIKWIIRFIKTPMNIFKQMIEYSPAGLSTLPGAKDKTEQSAKVLIGSTVFATAWMLALLGRTTWSAPTSEKDKNDFYMAGKLPYSIRIGDNWVSYQQLGPLAAPMALASALNYFFKESPNALSDTDLEKLADTMSGMMKFYSDMSYLKGLGDLVSFGQGEKPKLPSSLVTQVIPLSSLQGWINGIIDDLQRKPDKKLSFESILQNIEMKIIGLSKLVPPQKDAGTGLPIKKPARFINAISPAKVSPVNPQKEALYKQKLRVKQQVNKTKRMIEDRNK